MPLLPAVATACFVSVTAVAVFAVNTVLFGPESFARSAGKPDKVTRTFEVASPPEQAVLRVVNHGVTSAVVWVNDQEVLRPDDFHKNDRDRLERQIRLAKGSNRISVENRGKPGTSLTIEIIGAGGGGDTTPPTVTATVTPAPNAQGWHNSDVTVTFACSDDTAVAACPPPRVISGEGAGQIVSGTATDTAGNSATTSVTLNIDKTAPQVSATQAPDANSNGWNQGPVVVTFAATDALSGVLAGSVTAPVTLSADGSNQSAAGQASDLAGNVGTATRGGINIDRIAPVITVALTPDPNNSGWIDTPVTATFTCRDDAGSGIDSCPADRVVATEGANQTVTGVAIDKAGNTASVTSAAFNLDFSAPTITVSLLPPPNANGWNTSPVTARFTCSDSGSGVVQCPPDQLFDTDGTGLTATGTVTDAAGRTASVTSAAFKLDQTPPTITVTLSPEPPGPSGWVDTAVTAHFECADSGSGIQSCPSDQVISTEGANQTVSGTATDQAGNSALASSQPINIDLTAPTITALLDPPPNGNGWNNTPVTVRFMCADGGSGVAICPADRVIATDGANQTFTAVVVDHAGKTATKDVSVFIDQVAPDLSFAAPPNNGIIYTPAIALRGAALDLLSGITTVVCNSAPAALNGSQFDCPVQLTLGTNSIAATATDAAGNVASSAIDVTHVRMPKVTITQPADFTFLNLTPTTVSGTVDDPTVATVNINSVVVPVTGGNFTTPLPVAEGPNVITVTAESPSGAVATASVNVTLDTTPPRVTITSPPDKFETSDDSISVAGIVNDIVVGTVNEAQAQVTVQKVNAAVSNRTFLASAVPLSLGPNVIQAMAIDTVGNQATTEITVFRTVPATKSIDLVSGNNQSGAIRSLLSQPLVVQLKDSSAGSVANKTVIFKVIQNDGLLTVGGETASTIAAPTDAAGRAQVQWTLGGRAGAGGNVVEAYAVGFGDTAVFTASGVQGPATQGKIVVDTGNDQIGAITEPLPKPFIAVVVDEGNNRLAGVPVTFAVRQGGGSFKTQSQDLPAVTVVSDSDGRVAATLTLGLQEGNANNLVEATFDGNTGFPAAFSASGRAPGNPANTTISGVVLDNSNVPIPGVMVRAVLTNVIRSNLTAIHSAPSAQTNSQGQFTILNAPVGLIKLLVDGTTAELPGEYPSLEYDIVTVSGQPNDVGQPIYLLPLNTDDQHRLCVTAATGGGTLMLPEAPGFSLTFAPGQVTFPGGSKTGCISVTVVNGDKVPMVPGFGQQPRFIVTIQPAGAVFNPPAAITLPNVDGLKPRAVTEMYSFDHDIGSFVAIGTGVVSDDGRVIRSSPGVGVLKAGWHCGGDPAANGTVADCPVCQSCKNNACAPDDSNKPPQKCASCNAGKPVPPKTDAQCCSEKTVAGAGGWVVCCNGSQTACVAPFADSGTKGGAIIYACLKKHEERHFLHTKCSNPNECGASGPLSPEPPWTTATAECDAYKTSYECLKASNCGGDAACQAWVDLAIAQHRTTGNNYKTGCIP